MTLILLALCQSCDAYLILQEFPNSCAATIHRILASLAPAAMVQLGDSIIEDITIGPRAKLIEVGKYQAQLLDEETVDETCWKVVKQLASRSSIASDVRDGAIQMFGESNSFNASAANARKLKVLEPFSNRQLE